MPTNSSDGLQKTIARLAKINMAMVEKVVVETTNEAHEKVVEQVSNVRPHSGLSRERNPQETVTDLVDQGHYRAAWQTAFPTVIRGEVNNASVQATALEYGTEYMPGFFVGRNTNRLMAPIFKKNAEQALKEALR